MKKCPSALRTDCGTETGIMAGIHSLLHQNASAHKYGKSTANQRIENWWSHLKKSFTSWVMIFFKDLVENGIFVPGNYQHMKCAWFVFSDFIQVELDDFVHTSPQFTLHS